MKKTWKEKMQWLGGMVVVSGLTAYATFMLMSSTSTGESSSLPTESDNYVTPVNFTPVINRASVTDNDFTKAAEMTVNAVVGVKSVQQVQVRQSVDPFFDLFFGYRGQQSQPKAREGYGSGVIIREDGYIVTNNHVIEGAHEIRITLNDQRQFDAVLVGTDPVTDIALLKVEATDLPMVSFGESDNLKIGEWVLAVGNPFMLNSTVTAGIVSAKARSLGMGNGKLGIESFIQTDAAVNPGNSGGALVNTAGELVGINTAIYSQTGNYAGYSFAVPSSIVKKVVADLQQYGMVQRAVLGVSIDDVQAQLVTDKDLHVNEGVYVAGVVENSSAEDAGIQVGDVIVSVNNVKVKTVAQLQEQIARFRPGDKIRVTVDRKGQEQTFKCMLKNAQGNTEVITKKGIDLLGVTFQNLSKEELRRYGVRSGVMVKSLDKSGAFAREGIREKFVIVKINDVFVNSDKDIEAVYDKLTKDRGGDSEPVMFIVGVYPSGKTSYYAVDLSK